MVAVDRIYTSAGESTLGYDWRPVHGWSTRPNLVSSGYHTGGVATTRNCSVPEGATLFSPVLNQFTYNSPNVCGQGPQNLTAKEQQAGIKPFIDAAEDLSVTVDSRQVNKNQIRRIQADPFEVAFPADNWLVPFCGGDQPAGVYSPAVADGYYVSLDPLKKGQHTIHIQGQSSGFVVDVTYNLTIVRVSLK